jgi:transitional endoplasmic reticulum ATPase
MSLRLSILRATLKKSPIAADVDLSAIAKWANGYSGADLTEICQRACKLAIRESIEKDAARHPKETSSGENAMEVDSQPDPVPEITRAHFEEALKFARRSVSDADVRRYEMYSQNLQQQSQMTGPSVFSFANAPGVQTQSGASNVPNHDIDDDLYA